MFEKACNKYKGRVHLDGTARHAWCSILVDNSNQELLFICTLATYGNDDPILRNVVVNDNQRLTQIPHYIPQSIQFHHSNLIEDDQIPQIRRVIYKINQITCGLIGSVFCLRSREV